MKAKLLINLLRYFVGKNSAHIARKITTFLGGLLLASSLFSEGGIPFMDTPPITETEINDGLTLGEVIRSMIGLLMIQASRAMSFFRARNLDWLADWAGLLIGRSVHSLYRAALTVSASFLAWAGATGSTGTLADEPMVSIVGTLMALAIGGVSSFFQDENQNPVSGSPGKNALS